MSKRVLWVVEESEYGKAWSSVSTHALDTKAEAVRVASVWNKRQSRWRYRVVRYVPAEERKP